MPEISHPLDNIRTYKAEIVFSKTLQKVEWKNTRLIKENIAEEISKMKQEPGNDLLIFGSGSIVSTFMPLGLIDEYRVIVNPVVLGDGKPSFKGVDDKHNLKLLTTKVLSSGSLYFTTSQ